MKLFLTWIKRIFLLLCILNAVGLLAGMLSSYISPEKFWILSFFGLFFIFFFLVNFFFLIFWIIVRWRYIFLPLAALVISFPAMSHYFGIHFGKSLIPSGKTGMNIMSYNVRNFDLYQWNHNKETKAQMMKLITSQKPSIACFQEFYTSKQKDFKNLEEIRQRTGMDYVYFEPSYIQQDKNFWGIATFSKYPIRNQGKVEFDNHTQNACIWTDLKLDSSLIIRVFNVHLQSIKLKDKEYSFIDSLVGNQNPAVSAGTGIFGKMKDAYKIRSRQAQKIAESISKSPYPVILCGDFNDIPVSYAYQTIAKNMNDAFLHSGFGIGSTYIFFLPLFRIDYIFYDHSFVVSSFKTIHETYSDHYPIVAKIFSGN